MWTGSGTAARGELQLGLGTRLAAEGTPRGCAAGDAAYDDICDEIVEACVEVSESDLSARHVCSLLRGGATPVADAPEAAPKPRLSVACGKSTSEYDRIMGARRSWLAFVGEMAPADSCSAWATAGGSASTKLRRSARSEASGLRTALMAILVAVET